MKATTLALNIRNQQLRTHKHPSLLRPIHRIAYMMDTGHWLIFFRYLGDDGVINDSTPFTKEFVPFSKESWLGSEEQVLDVSVFDYGSVNDAANGLEQGNLSVDLGGEIGTVVPGSVFSALNDQAAQNVGLTFGQEGAALTVMTDAFQINNQSSEKRPSRWLYLAGCGFLLMLPGIVMVILTRRKKNSPGKSGFKI